jgi:hypothetical protein
MDLYGFLWIPMDAYGFLWIPMDSYGFLWIPMGSYGFLWILMLDNPVDRETSLALTAALMMTPLICRPAPSRVPEISSQWGSDLYCK